MKQVKVSLMVWAALAMLSVPGMAQQRVQAAETQCCVDTDDGPIEANLTKEDCENIGGDWHCFPNGRCSCF